MPAVSRPYALAAAALAATGAVIATPVLAHQVPLAIRNIETKLVDAGDIGNIPVNLFNDILNIPYNELQGGGLATMANSFLFTGTWWVPSSTNIWGIDPGDPTHIALIDNFIPFTAFTEGFTNSAGVYEPGLNYEFAGVLAAELPNSSSCDAISCAPMTPPGIFTGDTGYDRDIGFLQSLMGQGIDANGHANGLFTQFFQVPLQNLMDGYKFMPPPADTPTTGEPTYDPGALNPAGPVNDDWAKFLGWGSSGNPFEAGTTQLPDGTSANPWDGLTFHLNLLQPFQTLYDSLTQTPATDGIAGSGVEALSLSGVNHTFENLAAGLIIDFDAYTAGSPACPALCTNLPASMQIPALVQDIAKSDPSNTTLAAWVADYAKDPTLVNEPTQDQINNSIALLQTGSYNLSPTELANVDEALARINPELPALYTNAGIITDPNYLAYVSDPDTTTGLVGMYGGYNPNLVGTDLLTMLQDAGNHPVDPTVLADTNTVLTAFTLSGNPEALAALFGGTAASMPGGAASAAAEAPNLLGSFDPTTFTADLSTILGGLGTTAGSDAISAALADLSAQFTAELANFAPSLATMF